MGIELADIEWCGKGDGICVDNEELGPGGTKSRGG